MGKQFSSMSNPNAKSSTPVRLIDSLASTEAMWEVFSDRSVLRAMLDFEAALARVEGRLGVIPAAAAGAIEKVAKDFPIADVNISREAMRAGTPAIPFVKMLTERRARIRSRRRGLRSLGRHQPGRHRHRARASARQSAHPCSQPINRASTRRCTPCPISTPRP